MSDVKDKIRKLIDELNYHGLLYENGDADQLAGLILKLYRDGEFYDKIRYRCLERAKEYDLNRMVSMYEKVYNELVKE